MGGSFNQLSFEFCNPIIWNLWDKLRKVRFRNCDKHFLKIDDSCNLGVLIKERTKAQIDFKTIFPLDTHKYGFR